ncbi:hypothetical protein GJAV_G00008390 [Gymnothorax javanicus]|nr:hypothetical protein GJAV_G00008390 [Gymnothorax javanicus]
MPHMRNARVVNDRRFLLQETPAYKMASSTGGGFVVVTQVYPQQSGATPLCTSQGVSSTLKKFLKGDPKALGTVQIMIGLLVILFGIIMSINTGYIAVYSGIVFWGGLIFISSGALSVAATNKLNRCLVRGALGMNIISTITAGIAIILFSLDFVFEWPRFGCSYDEDSYSYYSCRRLRDGYRTLSDGMKGVLLLFSILEFIISISVSAFACKAVCHDSPQQVIYIQPTSSEGTTENLLVPPPNTHEVAVSPIVSQSVMGSMPEMPPKYDELLA